MTFKSVKELDNDLGETWNTLTRDQALVDYFDNNQKLWFYLQLDKILCEDFLGQAVKMNMVLAHIKMKYPLLYEETILRSKELCAVLD